MDFQEWKKISLNCDICIVSNKLDGFFKEVYDFLKYKKCNVLRIYSDDGESLNWHFEDTIIEPQKCISGCFDRREVGCDVISLNGGGGFTRL